MSGFHSFRKTLSVLLILSLLLFIKTDSWATVVISEFMASNSTTLKDEDGDYSDWIELYNRGNETVSLKGWGLSNSENDPYEWVFPEISLSAGQRMIVFASGKDRTDPDSELHTNFRLSAEGEYLALTGNDGIVRTQFSPAYPPQYPDISYGETTISFQNYLYNLNSPLSYLIPEEEDALFTNSWHRIDFESLFPEAAQRFIQGTNGIGYEEKSQVAILPGVDKILEFSPEGYWRFNETSGQILTNSGSAGSTLNLSSFGNVALGVNGAQGENFPGFEDDNLAIEFGGTDSYVGSQEPLLNDLTSFTLAGWIKANNINFNRTGLFGQNDALEFGFISNTQLHFWSSQCSTYADVNIQPNTWYHIALTGDGTSIQIYINGILSNYTWAPVSNYGRSDFPFTIGGRTFDADGGEFDGIIDEVIFCKRALSSADILSIYKTSSSIKDIKDAMSEIQPDAWWEMEYSSYLEYNSGSLGYNIYSAATDITQVEGPRPSNGFPGAPADNLAGYFNGYSSRIQIDYTPSLNGTEFSVGAWVCPEQKTSGTSPIFVSRNYTPYNGYILMIDESGRWCFVLTETASSQAFLTGPAVEYEKWSFVVGSFDGSTARIYVDGEEVASMEIRSFLPNPTQKSRVGYGSPNGSDYFLGAMDEPFYLNRAITPGECKNIYQVALGMDESSKSILYFSDYIKTDISDKMKGNNSSIYIRAPFQIESRNNIEELTLRLRYVDGAVVYLNQQELFRENAPDTLNWNSTALSDRLNRIGATPLQYDLTPYKDLLQIGENILAIQGLNASAEETSFLIQPELTVKFSSENHLDWRYFMKPTPNEPNTPGTDDLGPIIKNTSSNPALPNQPLESDPITITTEIYTTELPIQSVSLTWRAMFGAQHTLEMFDDGTHGDGAANDGIYGAVIPAGSAHAGEMIRWYITAEDMAGNTSRWPLFYNSTDSEEYMGTVLYDSSLETSRLPILHLFTENTVAMDNGNVTRLSAFYNGEFYDNISISPRGQTTRSFTKKPYKLDFNKDHQFMYGTNTARVGKVNLMSNYADKTKIHNSLAYEYIIKGGSVGHWCFPIRIQRNGAFFSLSEMLENGTEDWIERIGWDRDGLLYKIYDNMSSVYSAEKKTRTDQSDSQDRAAYQKLIDNLNESIAQTNRIIYAYDNINIPQTISYFATLALISSQDHGHKNFYLYQDCNNTEEWSLLPWDIDLSWGRNWLDSPGYLSDTLYTNNVLNFYNSTQQSKESNRLYNLFFNTPEFRLMYLTRLRTLSDLFLQNSNMPAAQSPVAESIRAYLEQMDPSSVEVSDSDLDHRSWSSWGTVRTQAEECERTISTYISGRANWFTNVNCRLVGSFVPEATPADALLQISGLDFQPYSGDVKQKYIRLTNTNDYALDISGWKLMGAAEFTFLPGTVVPPGKDIYVSPHVKSFRTRTEGPGGSQGLYVTGPWSGELSARGGTLTLMDNKERWICEYPYSGSPNDLLQYLRITELMYHPLPNPPLWNNSDDFEYIELKNISTDISLDLSGVSFTRGLTYTFPGGTTLAPQERIVLVKNQEAFCSRYGTHLRTMGPYTGSLSNSGEVIRLEDPQGEMILEFSYKDSWYPQTDGLGYSLIIADENASWSDWGNSSQWGPSRLIYGNPGTDKTLPIDIPQILINEILANPAEGENAAIELYNPESSPADISGWYLSDEYGTPAKYQFPAGTIIPEGGYLVIDAELFTIPCGEEPPINLNIWGDEIWLFSTDGTSTLTGYTHGFTYGAAEPGITWGITVLSTGQESIAPLSLNTLGQSNAYPLIRDIVFDEIMYHPITETDEFIQDEYVKLTNRSAEPISLYDEETGQGWYFTQGITWQFSAQDQIPAHGSLVLVNFDPQDTLALSQFMAAYGITQWPEEILLCGPYSGKLSNSGETLTLVSPRLVDESETPVEFIVDTLTYGDSDPWPGKADGKGDALRKDELNLYSNDPFNWSSKTPAPAALREFEAIPPELTYKLLDGRIILTFTGTLQSSSDLLEWNSLEKAKSPYTVTPGGIKKLYFRAVNP